NKSVKFVHEPNWYHGVEYPKEQERGYQYKEDLYVPGYFELSIEKDESIVFCAGDAPRKYLAQLPEFFDQDILNRTPRNSFYNCLKNSSHQLLYNPRGKDFYYLAGYPWFKVRARDMFIALPGATLGIDEKENYELVMQTAMPAIQAFMREGEPDAVIREIHQPDVLLWVVWCIQRYQEKTGLEEAKSRYGDLAKEIIEYIMDQRHPNLKVMDDGLVYAEGRTSPVTWMNSVVDGRPVIPRSGFIVEFNALWYNALCYYKELFGEEEATVTVDGLIEGMNTSFPAIFVNKYNYLFDYVDGPGQDWSVRPNMVIALACKYSPLTRAQKRSVLDIATKELLTPKGLRSLSPKSEGYRPICTGTLYERNMSQHQGAVWPWLIGVYLTAYLNLFGKGGISFAERMMISLEEEMSHHCIGTLPEVFDGNPPFPARGAFSFLMSIATVLDVMDKLKSMDN
ncbi:MAG: amylo-alpha-1,6-glucosidase, partial [Tannerella sp.]|nr:amylo-alpha-1,6-glucosidase [Tannerella sp.]